MPSYAELYDEAIESLMQLVYECETRGGFDQNQDCAAHEALENAKSVIDKWEKA